MAKSYQKKPVNSIYGMQRAVMAKGADVNIVQLKPESFVGELTFARLGTVILSSGSVRGSVRIRGPLSRTAHTIGIVEDAHGICQQWTHESQTGDIGVFPAGVEHEARYETEVRYATLTVPLEELLARAEGCHPHLAEAFWNKPEMYRPPATASALIIGRLQNALREIGRTPELLHAPHACENLLDDLFGPLLAGLSSASGYVAEVPGAADCPAKIVSRTEDYTSGGALQTL